MLIATSNMKEECVVSVVKINVVSAQRSDTAKTGNPLLLFLSFHRIICVPYCKNVFIFTYRRCAACFFSRSVICKCFKYKRCVKFGIRYGQNCGIPWSFFIL